MFFEVWEEASFSIAMNEAVIILNDINLVIDISLFNLVEAEIRNTDCPNFSGLFEIS